MAIYTVHVPRSLEDAVARADRTAFIRDGFNGWAFWFGPLFLLRYRAWIAAAVWVVVVLAGAWMAHLMMLPVTVEAALLLLLECFVGLEGNNLRRMALEGRGYAFADVVAGVQREDCERAFFQTHAERGSVLAPPAPVRSRASAPATGEPGPVIGLFPEPEARA